MLFKLVITRSRRQCLAEIFRSISVFVMKIRVQPAFLVFFLVVNRLGTNAITRIKHAVFGFTRVIRDEANRVPQLYTSLSRYVLRGGGGIRTIQIVKSLVKPNRSTSLNTVTAGSSTFESFPLNSIGNRCFFSTFRRLHFVDFCDIFSAVFHKRKTKPI